MAETPRDDDHEGRAGREGRRPAGRPGGLAPARGDARVAAAAGDHRAVGAAGPELRAGQPVPPRPHGRRAVQPGGDRGPAGPVPARAWASPARSSAPGQVINVPDAYADPRFNPAIDRQTGFRTRSILTCPLAGWDNTTVGVLQVLNKRTGPFDAWDEVLAQTFGAQAGVAVQRQLLLEEYEREAAARAGPGHRPADPAGAAAEAARRGAGLRHRRLEPAGRRDRRRRLRLPGPRRRDPGRHGRRRQRPRHRPGAGDRRVPGPAPRDPHGDRPAGSGPSRGSTAS